MKHRHIYFCSLSIGIWLTLPVLTSANGLQYSEGNRNAPESFILKVQEWEKERGGSWIPSYGGEMFRESRDRSSDTDTRSYSDSLGPSFDLPDSVDGTSRSVNPWWDRPSSADPMVRDLSGMDGGGFSSPGNGGGSVPGYHGR